MSPLNVTAPSGVERISKTKVTGLIMALVAAWRVAENTFGFQILPADVETKIGPVIDLAYMVGGFVVILFRGKKG